MTLLIVDLLQLYVCSITSGVTRCTHSMMLYLDRMCQCELHAVPWSHIGILMHNLAAEPRSRTSQSSRTFVPLSVSLWNDLADPVFNGVGLAGFKRRENALFIGPTCSIPKSSTIFPFLFFLSIGWYCGVGLIGCISLSLSLTLPTSFNNNNNAFPNTSE